MRLDQSLPSIAVPEAVSCAAHRSARIVTGHRVGEFDRVRVAVPGRLPDDDGLVTVGPGGVLIAIPTGRRGCRLLREAGRESGLLPRLLLGEHQHDHELADDILDRRRSRLVRGCSRDPEPIHPAERRRDVAVEVQDLLSADRQVIVGDVDLLPDSLPQQLGHERGPGQVREQHRLGDDRWRRRCAGIPKVHGGDQARGAEA